MEKRMYLPNDVMLTAVSEMVAEGKEVVILARGSSMMPFIVGDRDSVNLVAKDSYEVGDIVLSEVVKGRWVLHRLIAVDGQKAVLKGDGNLFGVEKCLVSDIRAYASQILPPGRKPVECDNKWFQRRSKIWRSLHPMIRRYYLAIFRRLI